MTNNPHLKFNLGKHAKSVIERVSHCMRRQNSSDDSCFSKHRIVRSRSGEVSSSSQCCCSFVSTSLHHESSCYRALPAIQTIFREKTNSIKWYTDMLDILEDLSSDPNRLNRYGEAPLCIAAFKSQGLLVSELLKLDNIKVNIKGRHGRTPLYIAAEEGHVFVVKCLLAHPDIDVNSLNSPGQATPLMIASRKGHSRVVELLLQHPDCDPHLLDREGLTAKHFVRRESIRCRLEKVMKTEKSRLRQDSESNQHSNIDCIKKKTVKRRKIKNNVPEEKELLIPS